MSEPPVSIDLSKTQLLLTECLVCRALVLHDSFHAHQAWHARQGDLG